MILVFSVHADDAIFSCGEYIAQHAQDERVVVVNLCSWTPISEDPAWQLRLNAEHEKACAHLGAIAAEGGFADGKWNDAVMLPDTALVPHLFRMIQGFEAQASEGASTILVPLGIHHPDHVYFAPALRQAALERPSRVAVYEDLPYRVMYPDLTASLRRDLLLAEGAHLESIANAGFLKQKLEACALYESQWSPPEGDAPRCCSAPERIWSLR